MKLSNILLLASLYLIVHLNLFAQENNITPEERRARIVEAYNRQMQMNENSVKGNEDLMQ